MKGSPRLPGLRTLKGSVVCNNSNSAPNTHIFLFPTVSGGVRLVGDSK